MTHVQDGNEIILIKDSPFNNSGVFLVSQP